MDLRVLGLLLDRRQTGWRGAANRELASRNTPRQGGLRTAALAMLIALSGAALALAPVVSWAVWFRGRW